MGVRKSVFGSKMERENFFKLSRQWSDKYRLYHNLPFLNVFDVTTLFDLSAWNKLGPIHLTDIEFSRLKKTSIDYTLCDTSDKPILCLEFDGLQQGYNVGTAYHSNYPHNIWRKEITELKLKVTFGSLFPFFVVGSDQFKYVSEESKLTIVDGIIGDVLAHRATQEKFRQGFDPTELGWTREQFESLPESEKSEMIQDWVWGVEVDAEMENNPISAKASELDDEISKTSTFVEHLTYPDMDDVDDIVERFHRISEAQGYGARVTIKTEDFGDIKAAVWLPNFKTPGFFGLSLAEDIAELVALEKLKNLRATGSSR